MPINLELKARFASLQEGRRCAHLLGAVEAGVLVQEDTYFAVTSGRLKLREIAGAGAELLSYTRPESTDERWSTYESVPVTDSARMKTVLGEALGVRTVVRKTRHLFLHKGARIHLDDVEGLGTFIEFEVPVAEGVDAALHMHELREAFGIAADAVIRGSYADLGA
jgi:predicted adenylyl cyclase CyaB